MVLVEERKRAKMGAGTSARIRGVALASKVTAPKALEGRGAVAAVALARHARLLARPDFCF